LSVRDQLLKHKSALIGGEFSADDETLVGNFDGKAAQFGSRKVSGASREVFFRVKIAGEWDLPLWMQNYCPLIFPEGAEFEKADIRLEAGSWLTRVVRPGRDVEGYFSAQTADSIKEHFTSLSRLACEIEKGDFSLRRSIHALQKKSILRLSFLLAGALTVIILSVIVISAPVIYTQNNVPRGNTQHSGEEVLVSTQVARAQADYAMRERRIFPSNSNIFLNVTADRTVVALGEKIILSYKVYTRYSAKCWGFYNVGRFQNFKVLRKDPDKNTPREEVEYQGKKFIRFAAGTAMLSPLKIGEQIIYPGTVFITARSEAGEIMDIYLTTKPMTIRVFEEIKQA